MNSSSRTAQLVDGKADAHNPSPPAQTPSQIFLRFLRFGLLAWGGPVAQIAMIRRELVEEEHWLSSGRFNRLLAIYQVLPGPEAHELCVHIGMLAGRRLGGLLAGLGFMLPGFLLMFALSWLYITIDITQSLGRVFLGVQVAVVALIIRAVYRIGEHVLLDKWLWGIGLASALAALLGASFWITLPAAGLVYVLALRGKAIPIVAALAIAGAVAYLVGPGKGLFLPMMPAAGEPAQMAGQSVTWWALFLSGLQAGLLTFGGAYTAIPFLREDAVGRGWMTDAQFLDGLALSGILPAPLIIFSTFVGYFAGGPLGAIAMTIGIFLPAFGFSLLFHERLEKVVENRMLHSFLEGVAAGVVGLISATTLELAANLVDRLPSLWPALLIFVAALAVLYRWNSKMNVVLVVIGAGLMGWLFQLIEGAFAHLPNVALEPPHWPLVTSQRDPPRIQMRLACSALQPRMVLAGSPAPQCPSRRQYDPDRLMTMSTRIPRPSTSSLLLSF